MARGQWPYSPNKSYKYPASARSILAVTGSTIIKNCDHPRDNAALVLFILFGHNGRPAKTTLPPDDDQNLIYISRRDTCAGLHFSIFAIPPQTSWKTRKHAASSCQKFTNKQDTRTGHCPFDDRRRSCCSPFNLAFKARTPDVSAVIWKFHFSEGNTISEDFNNTTTCFKWSRQDRSCELTAEISISERGRRGKHKSQVGVGKSTRCIDVSRATLLLLFLAGFFRRKVKDHLEENYLRI